MISICADRENHVSQRLTAPIAANGTATIRADKKKHTILPHLVNPLRAEIKATRGDVGHELRAVELVREADVERVTALQIQLEVHLA
jgi:hypothetical protein